VRARLDQIRDGSTQDQLEAEVASLKEAVGPDPVNAGDLELADRTGELTEIEDRVKVFRDRASEFSGQIDSAERDFIDVAESIEAQHHAEAEVGRLEQLARDLDGASEMLSRAKDTVHANIAPLLTGTMRPWLPRITAGRYHDVHVDPATLELRARAATGEFRNVRYLSHGTAEQLFLLLRVALAEHLATTNESAPLILDDVTVHSDESRTVATLELLHEISLDHQIVLFTQEREVDQWAEGALHPERDSVIRLAGAITMPSQSTKAIRQSPGAGTRPTR
jgi:uncharacterized protein YhaN